MASDDATMNDNEFEDEEFEDEEEWEDEELEEEEAKEDENIAIDENDLNEEDFANDDDDFEEDGDAWDDDAGDDGWGDDGVEDKDLQDELQKNPMSTLLNEENTAKKPVPTETKKAINDNIDEVNMLPMFCGVPDLTAPAVMLGIKIKQFKGISRDQLAVWGLSGNFPSIFHHNFLSKFACCFFIHFQFFILFEAHIFFVCSVFH